MSSVINKASSSFEYSHAHQFSLKLIAVGFIFEEESKRQK